MIKVDTKDNEADIFTKPLDRATFERHRDTIMNRYGCATVARDAPDTSGMVAGGVLRAP